MPYQNNEKELEQYKHALDLTAGVIIRDKGFRIIYINDNFCHILGIEKSRLIEHQFTQLEFSNAADAKLKIKQRQDLLAHGTPWIGESCFYNNEEQKVWFWETITPFLNDDKVPYKYLSILINITDKQFEDQLEQHQFHLQDLIDKQINELKQARDTAESANKSKSEFLANMSHELRTPMHAILSFTNLSLKQFKTLPLDNIRTNKLFNFITNIEVSNQRLLKLLNNLLDLSKLESGKSPLNYKKHDIFLLCQQIETEYSAKIQEKNINFIVDTPTITTITYCDKNKILQVFSNLLANAIKFSPKNKSILVKFESAEIVLGKRASDTKKNAGILFSITDEGSGIPDKELSIVFDKFIQSSKTKDGSGGTGLGLSICQEIASAHKGKIWAENTPEGGATFKLFLPNLTDF